MGSREGRKYLVQVCMGQAWSGPHMYLLRIAAEARARGYESVVATSAGSELERRSLCAGFRTIGLHEDDRGSFWSRLSEVIRTGRCDTVHLHSIRGLPRGFISLPGHIQMVLTEHSFRSREVFHPLSRMALSRVDMVLATSDAVAAVNGPALGVNPERIRNLHHGVDLQRFHPEVRRSHRSRARRRFRFGEDDRVVLVPTVFRRVKNLGVLVSALGRMKKDSAIQLLLTGDFEADADSREYRQELNRQVAANGVRTRVHLTGFLDDIEEAYAAADIVAVPTELEAFGLPAIEAMACSLPVVGSNKGAFPELVVDGECGICLDVHDVESWTRTLERLAGDADLRDRFGIAGRTRAERLFSIEGHWDDLFAIYEAGRRPSGRGEAVQRG